MDEPEIGAKGIWIFDNNWARLVVTLYYDEELTRGEIGEVLGVTESRVSQLHTRAILWARPREPAET